MSVALVFTLWPAPPASAGQITSGQSSLAEKQRLRQRRIQEMQEREAARSRAKRFKAFVDESGVLVLSSTPERYANRAGYYDYDLKYRPIVVPDRFKKLREQAPEYIIDLVKYYSKRYNLDESLVMAVIKVESNFNPNAVSRAGASGLMQLMPGTALEMGVKDIFDPVENIAGGTQYLALMLALFRENLDLALAGYNAGPQAVKDNKGVPPYEETKNYIRLVKQWKAIYQREGYGSITRSGTLLARTDDRPRWSSVRVESAQADAALVEPGLHTVFFKSGLTQKAQNIVEVQISGRDYYILEYNGRKDPVRKDWVARIEKPA